MHTHTHTRTHTHTLLGKTLLVASCTLAASFTACVDDAEDTDEGLFADDDDGVITPRCAWCNLNGGNTNLALGTTLLHHSLSNYGFNQAWQEEDGKFHRFTGAHCLVSGVWETSDWWTVTSQGEIKFSYMDGEFRLWVTGTAVQACYWNLQIADNSAFTTNLKTGVLDIFEATTMPLSTANNPGGGTRMKYKMTLSSAVGNPNAPILAGDMHPWCAPDNQQYCYYIQNSNSKYSVCDDSDNDLLDYWLGVRTGLQVSSDLDWSASSNTAMFACHSSVVGKPTKWGIPNSTNSSTVVAAAESAAIAMSYNNQNWTNLGNAITLRWNTAWQGPGTNWPAPGYTYYSQDPNPSGLRKEGAVAASEVFPGYSGWHDANYICRGHSTPASGYYSINRNAGIANGTNAYNRDWDDITGAGNMTDCFTHLFLNGTTGWHMMSYADCHFTGSNGDPLTGTKVCP